MPPVGAVADRVRPRVPGQARCSCATAPGPVLKRLVRSGVEDQWLQLGAVHQRDDFAQHDQVIAGAVRMPRPAFERCRCTRHERAAGAALFEGTPSNIAEPAGRCRFANQREMSCCPAESTLTPNAPACSI
jgi:hypothetical protein